MTLLVHKFRVGMVVVCYTTHILHMNPVECFSGPHIPDPCLQHVVQVALSKLASLPAEGGGVCVHCVEAYSLCGGLSTLWRLVHCVEALFTVWRLPNSAETVFDAECVD